jgi:acyl-CoA thioester hydrolase
MSGYVSSVTFRVRYSETDRMDAIYNSRVLEWFEMGRNEYLREVGVSSAEMEARGIMLPVIEAHVNYRGRATYDDELVMSTRASMASRLRIRFDNEIRHSGTGSVVADGYTVHAVMDRSGRPARPSEWLTKALERVTSPDGRG